MADINGIWSDGQSRLAVTDPVWSDGESVLFKEQTGGAPPATHRRRIIISGFMKTNILITATFIIFSFIIGFFMGSKFNPIVIEKPIEKIVEKEIKPFCDYFVWHKNEKLCINLKLKEYIENLEQGNMNRLKSQRGVIKN